MADSMSSVSAGSSPAARLDLDPRHLATRAPVKVDAETAPTREADRVEVSQVASMLSKLKNLPEVRQDLVAKVRAELAAGTYNADDKLDAALDALLDDIEGRI